MPRQDGWDGAPFQMVTMDQLVPKDYFLRRIDEAVDFSFIREMVRPLYSNTGRPSLDPEVALRMFVLGALLGIPESRLCSEISPHAGYRWFCGLTFNDPLPHRSTLTKLRRERWGPSGAFGKAMERVFKQCAESGVLERVKGELEEERAKVARRLAAEGGRFRPPLTLAEYYQRLEEEDALEAGDPAQGPGG